MNGFLRALSGRARSAMSVVLLGAAILLVAALALQAQAAWSTQRRVATSVLRDYSRLAAEQFIRRTSAEIGYRGFYSAVNALQRTLGREPKPKLMDPSELQGALDAKGRPARELIRSLFLADPATGAILDATGEPLDDAARALLRREIPGSPDRSKESHGPFFALRSEAPAGERIFICSLLAGAEGRGDLVAGFEVNLDALGPWLERVMKAGPLLPASLGEGRPTNDLLHVELEDSAGRTLFSAGAPTGPLLATATPFGDTYSGIFEGLTVRTSIAPEAAPRLVIGGLPRSRLPLLAGLLLLTAGLLAAAVWQMRRERELARMRSEFVSRVSHELRTPLTQIRMFAETLLLGRDRSQEERRRSLEIIDQEARRLGHLVENVLQFSRGDRGAIRLAPRPVEVTALLRDVAESFGPLARARGMSVVLEDGGVPVTCLVDDDAMRQVILNLLDNAVKFGPAGQEIHVSVAAGGGKARLQIDDQGPGVPAADRERIWSRWQRLERDERRAIAGTGIGLTVVRELVTLQGGRVTLESAPRGGARFVVELPAMTGQAPSGSGEAAVPA